MNGFLAISFLHPWVFGFLAIPLLLVFFELQQKGRQVKLPFDHGEQRSRGFLRFCLNLTGCVPALLVAIVIVMLASPTKHGLPSQIRELTNIELCLDVSGSMTATVDDAGTTRYQAAMAAIKDFTTKRPGDAFGLTIFGNEVLRWVPLTKDMSAIQNATPFLDPQKLPHHFGGTEIGKGLLYCRKTLIEQQEGDRLIILLSDGVSWDLDGSRPQEISQQLLDDKIVLYSIFIGSGAAPEQLHRVTTPTGGEVFAVEDADGLKEVFAHIDKMKPAKLKPRTTQPVFDYYWFAIVALSLLGLYLLTLFGLRYTPW